MSLITRPNNSEARFLLPMSVRQMIDIYMLYLRRLKKLRWVCAP